MKTLNIFMCLVVFMSSCDSGSDPRFSVSESEDTEMEISEDASFGGGLLSSTAPLEDEGSFVEKKDVAEDTDDNSRENSDSEYNDIDTEVDTNESIETDEVFIEDNVDTEEAELDTYFDTEIDTDTEYGSDTEVDTGTEFDNGPDTEVDTGEGDTDTGEIDIPVGCEPWGYRDTLTNLCWQRVPDTNKKGLSEATNYCKSLGSGWRVPTIDEMRSTVRSCNYVNLDGSCRVHDDCTDWECWNPEENGCMSCSRGNRTDTDDCFFWLPGFEGACYLTIYGSSTLVTNYPVVPVKMWAMNFYVAGLYSYPSEGDGPEQYVSWRCVRSL